MKPEKDTPESVAAEEEQIHPMEVMRQEYRAMEITFQEDENTISTRLNLKNMEVDVLNFCVPDDLAAIIIRLPVRAAPEFRAQAGEFLHRLNYATKRKFWEIDYNDGEIRLASFMETMAGPLTGERFRCLLHYMAMHAETVFPYLTSVLSGRMAPDFAADQAEAATEVMLDTELGDDDE
ncbi:MAG: hypothetical protein WCH98_18615 [Verrucomicrobiota bacterium]